MSAENNKERVLTQEELDNYAKIYFDDIQRRVQSIPLVSPPLRIRNTQCLQFRIYDYECQYWHFDSENEKKMYLTRGKKDNRGPISESLAINLSSIIMTSFTGLGKVEYYSHNLDGKGTKNMFKDSKEAISRVHWFVQTIK